MNQEVLIYMKWSLSREYSFHAYFFESSYHNPDYVRIMLEIDQVLKNFKMVEHTRTVINTSILGPLVKLPLFYACSEITKGIIIYPYDTYGIIHFPYGNPMSPINFVKVKTFYNFLEENKIVTSMFNGIWNSL